MNLSITVSGNGSWLDAICSQSGVAIKENELVLPKDLGTGIIREYVIEEGLTLTFGEMELKGEFNLLSTPSRTKHGINIFFKYLERGHSYFRQIGQEYTEVKSGGVQFFTTNVRNQFIIPVDTHCYLIRVYASMEWLRNNLYDFISQNAEFEELVFGPDKVMHFEPLMNRFVRLFKDVFRSEFNEKLIPLIVKDKGYEAVVLFFDHFYKQCFNNQIISSRYSISDQKRLYALVDYIKNNIGHTFTLEELSREVGFSKSKLQALFHYFFHQSIYAFIKSLKYEKASEMLLNTDMDIRHISHELGYNSSTHFINIFRDHFGVSPRKYRKTRHFTSEPELN
jgi:AraC-like DNA-binding protein